jgi:hypothetical protein
VSLTYEVENGRIIQIRGVDLPEGAFSSKVVLETENRGMSDLSVKTVRQAFDWAGRSRHAVDVVDRDGQSKVWLVPRSTFKQLAECHNEYLGKRRWWRKVLEKLHILKPRAFDVNVSISHNKGYHECHVSLTE